MAKDNPWAVVGEEDYVPKASAQTAPTKPKKAGVFDRVFGGMKGTPSWMQSSPERAKIDAELAQQYTEYDPTNPFTYLSEGQKEEQSSAGKALGKGLRATTRVGAGIAQGAVVDPAMAVAQLVGGRELANDVFNSYDTFRKNMGGEGFDASRLVGNIVSPVNRFTGAGASKIANSWGGGRFATSPFMKGATQGATTALAMPVLGESGGALGEDESILGGKLSQVGTGALFGGALNKALTPVGDKLSALSNQLTTGKLTPQQMAQMRNQELNNVDLNQLSSREALDLYKKMNPDAYLTWGQRGGEFLSNLEQKASSIPFIGDAIRGAQKKAQMDWNSSQLKNVAQEAGIDLEKTSGRKGFNELSKKLSSKYDDMLEGTTLNNPVKLRETIIGKIDDSGNYQKGKISDMYNELDSASQKKVDKLLEDRVFKKFGVDPQGNHSVRMTGKQFKNAEESLKEKIDELKMGSGEERTMARVLRSTLDEMFDQLQDKGGKTIGQPLKDLNKAYAKYKTLETASTARSGSKGDFSADQVIKASSKGAGRSNVARGRNEMANQAELAQNVWGDLVPDSGTAGRLMLAGAGIGGGSLFGLDPATTAGVGAGLYGLTRGAYSPAVMNALSKGTTGLGQKFDASRVGKALAPHAGKVSGAGSALGASDVQFFPEEKARGGMVGRWKDWAENYRKGGQVQYYYSFNKNDADDDRLEDFFGPYYAKGGTVKKTASKKSKKKNLSYPIKAREFV